MWQKFACLMDTESVSVVRDSLSSFSSEIHNRPFTTVHSGNLLVCYPVQETSNNEKQVVV